MFKPFLTSFAFILPSLSMAADYVVNVPVTAAIVSPLGATVTHQGSIDLPAGRHRVMVPFDSGDLIGLPRVQVSDAATVLGTEMLADYHLNPKDLFTPAQQNAFDTLEATKDQVLVLEDRIGDAEVQIKAIQARQNFLATIQAPTEQAATVAELSELADLVEAGSQVAASSVADLHREIREMNEELEETVLARTLAQQKFDRSGSLEGETEMLVLTLDVPEAAIVGIEFKVVSRDAFWLLDYDVDLNDGVSPGIVMRRNVGVMQETDEIWSDIDLTLTTSRSAENPAPRGVYRNMVRISEIQPVIQSSDMGGFEAPRMEMAVMMEETAGMGPIVPQDMGFAVSYHFPFPVTVVPSEVTSLTLPGLAMAADTEIHAVPRRDDTAFLMAKFTNTTGEPILPGTALFHRNGQLVGRGAVEMIAENDEGLFGFGPIESIRLETIFDRNNTGDKGFISRSNTRDQSMTLVVENLSDEPQSVVAFYALPFSEQEDLNVDVRSTPAPNQTDVDDVQGKSVWNLELAPGEERKIELQFTLDWPEGWELFWRP